MGLVMQEPTLFNYSIKDNILYGSMDAKNSEIREAAQVANALEFIESQSIMNTFEDTCEALLQQLEINASRVIEQVGDK